MNKLQFAITYFFIGIVLVACVMGMFSCNHTKQAARKAARIEAKAEKKLYQSISLDPMPFTVECAQKFNPIDSIHERIIYKPGKVITDTLIETEIDIVRDTVVITNTRTVYIKQTDTVDLSRYQSESNKAALDSMKAYYERKEDYLRKQWDDCQTALTKSDTQLRMYRNAAFILGIAWVLFFVWRFVKSKFKIFG